MLRSVISFASLVTMTIAPAVARGEETVFTGTILRVTDGDTFRLTDGTRIRIADIDSAETQRGQAKCAAEIEIGLRQKAEATALLGGQDVELRAVGRSYNRIVARVRWKDRDLGADLVRRGVARPWLRGKAKPDWCAAP